MAVCQLLPRQHVLMTGLPGVGKTTLIQSLVKRLAAYQPAGFYTEEIRGPQGTREGFRLISLSGLQLILSHVNYGGPHRVGRYRVDLAGFERLLGQLNLPHTPSQLIVIDEIGKMECLSQRFKHEITMLLDSPRVLIASIAIKGDEFIRRVKDRPDCRLVTVTKQNRDRLVDDLLTGLQERLTKKTRPPPASNQQPRG
jgi:nucleoside-triphosphatase